MLLLQTPMIPFDPNQLIPLIATIGGMVVTGVVLFAFIKSDFMKAIAERIRARTQQRFGGHGDEDADDGRVAELEQRLGDVQGQLSDMAERLDFAERMLAQKRERSLPGA